VLVLNGDPHLLDTAKVRVQKGVPFEKVELGSTIPVHIDKDRGLSGNSKRQLHPANTTVASCKWHEA